MSAEALGEHATQLHLYSLGGLHELDVGEYEVPGILIRHLDGWPFWGEPAKFCAAESVSMEAFTEQLDFSALDE
jgi:hypothetical protein